MSKNTLLYIDSIARERNIDKEKVFLAVEYAIAQATMKTFLEEEVDIKVEIDRETGEHTISRRWLVVEDAAGLQNPNAEEIYSDAIDIEPNIQVGEYIVKLLDSTSLDRLVISNIKHFTNTKLRDEEKIVVVDEIVKKGEAIFVGTVKYIDRNDIVIEKGKLETRVHRRDFLPRENFREGDKFKALIVKVDKTNHRSPIELSRTSPQFMIELFKEVVPEINQGLLEIKGCARDPGVRAKLSVYSQDKKIDPVGTCVGVKGSRVNAVTKELAGERVDIVTWDPDIAQYITRSLSPAEVKSCSINEEENTVNVTVDDASLANAIGKNGQNVMLAHKLTGWKINILSATEDERKQRTEFDEIKTLFLEQLDVDEDVAITLVNEGFDCLEAVAYVPEEEMLEIDGFDEEMINELKIRARNALLNQQIQHEESLEAQDNLLTLTLMTPELQRILLDGGVSTRSNLADLALDELIEITSQSEEEASKLILEARGIS